jgi:hypothetical protein
MRGMTNGLETYSTDFAKNHENYADGMIDLKPKKEYTLIST